MRSRSDPFEAVAGLRDYVRAHLGGAWSPTFTSAADADTPSRSTCSARPQTSMCRPLLLALAD
jgi:hypothetical protein